MVLERAIVINIRCLSMERKRHFIPLVKHLTVVAASLTQPEFRDNGISWKLMNDGSLVGKESPLNIC
jgi:hypothetical protein